MKNQQKLIVCKRNHSATVIIGLLLLIVSIGFNVLNFLGNIRKYTPQPPTIYYQTTENNYNHDHFNDDNSTISIETKQQQQEVTLDENITKQQLPTKIDLLEESMKGFEQENIALETNLSSSLETIATEITYEKNSTNNNNHDHSNDDNATISIEINKQQQQQQVTLDENITKQQLPTKIELLEESMIGFEQENITLETTNLLSSLETIATEITYEKSSTDSNNNNNEQQSNQRRRHFLQPIFVPFPHNDLGIGVGAQCKWIARDPSDRNDSVVRSLLGLQNENNDFLTTATTTEELFDFDFDDIQKQMLRETICWQTNSTHNLHLFSTDEARACLKNITLLITGDSCTKQFFIGLADILLPNNIATNNYRITNSKVRTRELEKNYEKLKELQTNQPELGLDIYWACEKECYGESRFASHCSVCLNIFFKKRRGKKVIVPVVGAMVHIYSARGSAGTIDSITRFFNATTNGIIYVTQPSYDLDLTPEEYRNVTGGREQVYFDLLRLAPKFEHRVRIMDMYQITGACQWENCTSDGGHRHRFVNRWKAQLLLNTLCSV